MTVTVMETFAKRETATLQIGTSPSDFTHRFQFRTEYRDDGVWDSSASDGSIDTSIKVAT
jgi:hypothetical protein